MNYLKYFYTLVKKNNMNWNLEQAITISALNLVCSDGDVDQKELKEIYDSPFFSKYVNQSMFDWYL